MSVGQTGRYLKKEPEGLESFLTQIRTSNVGPLISEVGTKGKFMWWKFDLMNDPVPWFMHCTYGMSGGWFTSPTNHSAFVVEYSDSGIPVTRDTQHVFFNDPRHFGTIKFVRGGEVHEKKLRSLGPCILTSQMTPSLFATKVLGKPVRTIAEALMDQATVSGIGNYIKAEVLYRSGVSPWRPVTEITPQEYEEMCQHVLDVASESYKSRGATISTYRTVDGQKGATQFDFKVYSMKRCPLGHEVSREETPEGRTSHWCKVCQK